MSIVENTLKEKYVKLSVNNFILKEKKKTNIECDISFSNAWKNVLIEGSGSGVVDALFAAMIEKFSEDFFSLGKVSFDDFIMEVKFKSNVRKSASPVEIKIALKNAAGRNIYFSSESYSMVKAAISVVVSACEYLINAEMAIIQLRKDIKNARERRRNDLVDAYTNDMISLVGITSYEEVL